VSAYRQIEGYDRPEYVPVEGAGARCVLFVSASMVRFLLSDRTTRPAFWEPFLVDLEQKQLRAFAQTIGVEVVSSHVDPGPQVPDSARPFTRLAAEATAGQFDTILLSDFNRVPRRDLLTLWEMVRERGGRVLSQAPHPSDDNLAFDNVDFHWVPDSWADHRPLERIWTKEASETVNKLFEAVGWHWTHYAADLVARAIGPAAIKAWRDEDPACRRQSWKEVLTRFTIARTRRTGELERLGLPRLLACVLCGRDFLDASMPIRLMEMTAGRVEYCPNCLYRAFSCASDEIREWIGPPEIDDARFASTAHEFFRGLDPDRMRAFLRTVIERLDSAKKGGLATVSSVWLGSLRDLDLLPDYGGVARSENLFKSIDGHLTTCLGAALLDNWLGEKGLAHRPESRYPADDELNPSGSIRADFRVGDALVEFLGMRGQDEFGKRIEDRIVLAKRHGVALVGFYAEDLLDLSILEAKAAPLIALGD